MECYARGDGLRLSGPVKGRPFGSMCCGAVRMDRCRRDGEHMDCMGSLDACVVRHGVMMIERVEPASQVSKPR